MYKDLPEYKNILAMGYADLTSMYNSRKSSIAIGEARFLTDGFKNGDMIYIIQRSGYIRRGYYDDGSFRSEARVDYFTPNLDNYDEIGIKLLYLLLAKQKKLISNADQYKARALIKARPIVVNLFKSSN